MTINSHITAYHIRNSHIVFPAYIVIGKLLTKNTNIGCFSADNGSMLNSCRIYNYFIRLSTKA